ncbi:Predicted arabinose efflux permease, MFS family [Enhydrobacter aerosaccus]|uniref:Predicted arabinose efflux permease, MFS family n=1 Tax=Enhydrobacter aerosaccus TaxID=225324 RepID=A0A1T4RNF2_9HYPH|nr:Predicted arabinose efflux permease, MFS family [Enhydrobacter aerosaccus]
MTFLAHVPALAPFRVRSFRFQWPADLLASWAFEMEGVILGWFVLVSTQSVTALALFGSLQFLGTLISPFFGMAGDRIGNRNLICLMRITYVGVALCLALLFLTGFAAPLSVFALATVMGLVRPSDITMRNLLVGESMPGDLLMRAMSVSRTTADIARVVGALSGATLVAALGSGLAYVVVCSVYVLSFLLSLNVGIKRLRMLREEPIRTGPLKALREGFAYVWSTPDVRAATLLAFLMNFAAYPLVGSLLAHVAKDIYGMDQTGLGWLIASFAIGALAGSIVLSIHGSRVRAARTMIASALLWFALNFVFSWVETPRWGELLLVAMGTAQSFCMVPMAVLLLRTADPAFRGRVMGVRMLAVYGLPLGLVLSGPLVEHLGFAITGSLFSLVGIVFTMLIASHWREHLWYSHAAANLR